MTIETIYNEIKEITKDNDINYLKFIKLRDKLEEEIRKTTCYKTTNKTRVNAIKKIASQDNIRPALKGYGIFGDYKGVTDSYHAILIKQNDIPLPLVATAEQLKELGINYKEYIEEHGSTSLINAVYPDLIHCINVDNYDKSNELELDINDLVQFIKLNKKEINKKEKYYKIGDYYYNPIYVKNIIDVIGKNCKIYFQGEYKPLYFVNDNEEIGLVLPIRNY